MSLFEKITFFHKSNFDDLYNTFLGLEQKQQSFVLTALVVMAVIILALPVSCVSSKLSNKEAQYHKYMQMASEFYGVEQEYAARKKDLEKFQGVSEDLGIDPLKTVLIKMTDELGVEQKRVNLKKINPVEGDLFVEQGREVRITNVRLDHAFKILDQLEKYPDLPIRIKKFTLQVDPKNKQSLRALSFTMTTVQPKK